MAALRFLLAPGSLALLSLAVLAGAAALLRRGRLARAGRIWIAAWLVAYLALSLPAVARQLHASLAPTAASFVPEPPSPQVVVVLSGGASPYRFGAEVQPIMSVATMVRVREAARVYTLLDAPLVVASGAGRGAARRGPETDAMRDGLLAAGVPADRILVEDRSADTHESAIHVRALLQARGVDRVVLVTSALHVPRAVRAFRAAGLDVVPAPAAGVPERAEGGWRAFVPALGALALSERCLHEYAGLAYYWLRGWG